MLLSQRITGLCDAILSGRFIGDRLAIVQELRRYVEEDRGPGLIRQLCQRQANAGVNPETHALANRVLALLDPDGPHAAAVADGSVAQDYGARACCTPVVLSVGQQVLSRDANGDWRPARLTDINSLGAYPFEVEYLDGRSATSIGGAEVQRAWKKPADIRPIPPIPQ